MVLINETKYACQACIKGHRSTSCLHHDRPLFEIAKKGRPVKQCEHCRDLRKTKAVSVKCQCAKKAAEEVKAEPGPSNTKGKTKRRDPTLGAPALPNGLKDVHDMAAAAEALKDMTGGSGPSNKKRVDDLLNPCECLTGGKCTCCAPRAKPAPPPTPASASSPLTLVHPLPVVNDLFRPTPSLDELPRAARSLSASSSAAPSRRPSVLGAPSSSQSSNTLHYAPYPKPSSRITMRSSVAPESSATGALAATPEMLLRQGLRDLVSNYMKAKQDHVQNALVNFSLSAGGPGTSSDGGSVSIGLPEAGEEKIEEVLMVSTCTCGDDCACPSCKEHGNAPVEGMELDHEHGCGDNCNSCFACSSHVAMPANLSTKAAMQTVADLLASSSRLPPPPLSARPIELDPHNLAVLPPSAFVGGDESRAAFGLMQVPKLECCTGRCKCPPGECTCMSDCCGCCEKCLCDDEEEEARLAGIDPPHAVLVASSSPSVAVDLPRPLPAASSCCSAKTETTEDAIPPPPLPAPAVVPSTASSCCAPPAPATPAASPSCCGPPANTSTTPVSGAAKSKGKKACGGGSCSTGARPPPAKLRPLLPKPSTESSEAAAVRRALEQRSSPALPAANGVPSEPLAFDAAPGQLDFAQWPAVGQDPFATSVTDAQLDELMASLAAANGGTLDGLLFDHAAPVPPPLGIASPELFSAGAYAADSSLLPNDGASAWQDEQFDLDAFVNSLSPLTGQPSPPSHADLQQQMPAHGLFGAGDPLEPTSFAGVELPADLAPGELDWSQLLANVMPSS